jgi:hypothetical protein
MCDPWPLLRECGLSSESDERENQNETLHKDLLSGAGAVDEFLLGIMPDLLTWGKTVSAFCPNISRRARWSTLLSW